MILTLQIPEEYRAQILWERPIGTISKSMRLCSAQFVPNQAIYPNGAFVRLLIYARPQEQCFAVLEIEKDLKGFGIVDFDIVETELLYPQSVISLRKELENGRSIALPNSLVQLELE